MAQFEDVTTAANSLRNAVSKEARQMGTVSLLSLDRRTIDGYEHVAWYPSICLVGGTSVAQLQ